MMTVKKPELELFYQLPAPLRYKKLLQGLSPDSYYFQRHKAWLNVAQLTFLNHLPTDQVCKIWSQETDRLVQTVWDHCQLQNENLALFALGKWGGEELNLSSDIDFMVISESSTSKDELKKVRHFITLLSQVNENGFLYRTDTDIRAGGKWGQLISSLDQFQNYFWSHGEVWERMAFIRLRPICGSKIVMNKLSHLAKKFSFRRFIDYRLSEELKEIRAKIFKTHFLSLQQNPLPNLKFSPGGIRDIELFIHSLQLIHGGKNKKLQTHLFNEAIQQLQENNFLPSNELSTLQTHYWELRHNENLSQLFEDQQNYFLNTDSRLNIFNQNNQEDLEKKLQISNSIVTEFLGPSHHKNQTALPDDLSQQTSWLTDTVGLSQNIIDEIWPLFIEIINKRDSRKHSVKKKKDFISHFFFKLKTSNYNKDFSFKNLYYFLKNTRTRSSFLDLLLNHPALFDDFIFLLSTSHHASQLFINRPELLDSYLYKVVAPFSHNLESLYSEIADAKLLTEIISTRSFLKEFKRPQLEENCSSIADHITSHLLHVLKQHLNKGSSLQILALGKWGSQELGLGSDLDFIFVSPTPPQPEDYKIAQRFIRYLTGANFGGSVYNIDLRLRPSGSAGPLLVTEAQLQNFLTKADAWVKQAYLRMRWISDRPLVYPQLTPIEKKDLPSLLDIRQKLLQQTDTNDHIDIKYNPGGLIDSELCFQTLFLTHLSQTPSYPYSIKSLADYCSHQKLCAKDSAKQLYENYNYLRNLEQSIKAINQFTTSKLYKSSKALYSLNQVIPLQKKIKYEDILSILNQNKAIIKTIDPTYNKGVHHETHTL